MTSEASREDPLYLVGASPLRSSTVVIAPHTTDTIDLDDGGAQEMFSDMRLTGRLVLQLLGDTLLVVRKDVSESRKRFFEADLKSEEECNGSGVHLVQSKKNSSYVHRVELFKREFQRRVENTIGTVLRNELKVLQQDVQTGVSDPILRKSTNEILGMGSHATMEYISKLKFHLRDSLVRQRMKSGRISDLEKKLLRNERMLTGLRSTLYKEIVALKNQLACRFPNGVRETELLNMSNMLAVVDEYITDRPDEQKILDTFKEQYRKDAFAAETALKKELEVSRQRNNDLQQRVQQSEKEREAEISKWKELCEHAISDHRKKCIEISETTKSLEEEMAKSTELSRELEELKISLKEQEEYVKDMEEQKLKEVAKLEVQHQTQIARLQYEDERRKAEFSEEKSQLEKTKIQLEKDLLQSSADAQADLRKRLSYANEELKNMHAEMERLRGELVGREKGEKGAKIRKSLTDVAEDVPSLTASDSWKAEAEVKSLKKLLKVEESQRKCAEEQLVEYKREIDFLRKVPILGEEEVASMSKKGDKSVLIIKDLEWQLKEVCADRQKWMDTVISRNKEIQELREQVEECAVDASGTQKEGQKKSRVLKNQKSKARRQSVVGNAESETDVESTLIEEFKKQVDNLENEKTALRRSLESENEKVRILRHEALSDDSRELYETMKAENVALSTDLLDAQLQVGQLEYELEMKMREIIKLRSRRNYDEEHTESGDQGTYIGPPAISVNYDNEAAVPKDVKQDFRVPHAVHERGYSGPVDDWLSEDPTGNEPIYTQDDLPATYIIGGEVVASEEHSDSPLEKKSRDSIVRYAGTHSLHSPTAMQSRSSSVGVMNMQNDLEGTPSVVNEVNDVRNKRDDVRRSISSSNLEQQNNYVDESIITSPEGVKVDYSRQNGDIGRVNGSYSKQDQLRKLAEVRRAQRGHYDVMPSVPVHGRTRGVERSSKLVRRVRLVSSAVQAVRRCANSGTQTEEMVEEVGGMIVYKSPGCTTKQCPKCGGLFAEKGRKWAVSRRRAAPTRRFSESVRSHKTTSVPGTITVPCTTPSSPVNERRRFTEVPMSRQRRKGRMRPQSALPATRATGNSDTNPVRNISPKRLLPLTEAHMDMQPHETSVPEFRRQPVALRGNSPPKRRESQEPDVPPGPFLLIHTGGSTANHPVSRPTSAPLVRGFRKPTFRRSWSPGSMEFESSVSVVQLTPPEGMNQFNILPSMADYYEKVEEASAVESAAYINACYNAGEMHLHGTVGEEKVRESLKDLQAQCGIYVRSAAPNDSVEI